MCSCETSSHTTASMTATSPSWLKWVIDHSAYTQPPVQASWGGGGGGVIIADPGYYYIAHPLCVLCCDHIPCAVCGGIHSSASIETLIAKQKAPECLPKHVSSYHSEYCLNTSTNSVSHSRKFAWIIVSIGLLISDYFSCHDYCWKVSTVMVYLHVVWSTHILVHWRTCRLLCVHTSSAIDWLHSMHGVCAHCGVWHWLWFRHWKPTVLTSVAQYPPACCRGAAVVISVAKRKQTLHLCTLPQRCMQCPRQDDCGHVSVQQARLVIFWR